jgi:hypothetical protein
MGKGEKEMKSVKGLMKGRNRARREETKNRSRLNVKGFSHKFLDIFSVTVLMFVSHCCYFRLLLPSIFSQEVRFFTFIREVSGFKSRPGRRLFWLRWFSEVTDGERPSNTLK